MEVWGAEILLRGTSEIKVSWNLNLEVFLEMTSSRSLWNNVCKCQEKQKPTQWHPKIYRLCFLSCQIPPHRPESSQTHAVLAALLGPKWVRWANAAAWKLTEDSPRFPSASRGKLQRKRLIVSRSWGSIQSKTSEEPQVLSEKATERRKLFCLKTEAELRMTVDEDHDPRT